MSLAPFLRSGIRSGVRDRVDPLGYLRSAARLSQAIGWGTFTVGWLLDEASGNLAPAFGATSLSAVNTPLRGLDGPFPGLDKAIGFGGASDAWNGGDVLDVTAAQDLVIAWVARLSALPSGVRGFLSKFPVGGASAWQLQMDNASASYYMQGNTAAAATNFTAIGAGLHVGRWHAGIAGIERATGKAGIATKAFDVSSPSVTPLANVSAIAFDNAASFRIGNRFDAPGNACLEQRIAYLAIGVAAGAATGLTANLSTAVVNLANAITQ